MTPALRLTGALADRDAWTADDCSLAAALDVLGARSTFLLLREALYGASRFEEFVRRTGLSEPVTATRLRALVDDGLLERVPYREPGQRPRQGYRLTDKGVALLPGLVALLRWGDQWVAEDGGPVELSHHGCGRPVAAVLRCTADHAVGIDEIDVAVRRRGRRRVSDD